MPTRPNSSLIYTRSARTFARRRRPAVTPSCLSPPNVSSIRRLNRREDSVIHSRKDIMSGMSVFKGTRVVVKNLSDYLASGYSLDVFLDDFPS